MHRGQGDKEHDATTRDRQGTKPPVEAGRWGRAGVQMVEEIRERKGTLDRITLRSTWT